MHHFTKYFYNYTRLSIIGDHSIISVQLSECLLVFSARILASRVTSGL